MYTFDIFESYFTRWCSVDVKDFVKKEMNWMDGSQNKANSCIYMQQSDDFASGVLLGMDDCVKQNPFVCEVENC